MCRKYNLHPITELLEKKSHTSMRGTRYSANRGVWRVAARKNPAVAMILLSEEVNPRTKQNRLCSRLLS